MVTIVRSRPFGFVTVIHALFKILLRGKVFVVVERTERVSRVRRRYFGTESAETGSAERREVAFARFADNLDVFVVFYVPHRFCERRKPRPKAYTYTGATIR